MHSLGPYMLYRRVAFEKRPSQPSARSALKASPASDRCSRSAHGFSVLLYFVLTASSSCREKLGTMCRRLIFSSRTQSMSAAGSYLLAAVVMQTVAPKHSAPKILQ